MATFFSGGTIWCGIGCVADSVRIDGEKIVEINGVAQPEDNVVDLKGGFLAPAFMDGHAHPLFGGREAQGPLVNGLQTVAEMVAEVKRFAEANPNTPWIVGGAYEAAAVSGGDFLATWLDEVVSDRPVVLQAVDHHTIWVNSKAIEIAGISAATVDPDGGTIARNPDDSARGTLREPSAMDLIMKHAPERTLEDDVAAIAWSSQRYLESGVTASVDAWVTPGMAEAYIAADKSGALKINMDLYMLAQPDSWRGNVEYFAKIREQVKSLGPIQSWHVKR